MPTAMRMVTTIVPVWVCTTNYGIPLFYSRIIKKKRLFVKCAIKCKIPRLFSRGITILEGFCVVLIYWLTHPLIGKNPQLSMKAVGDLCLDIEIYLETLEAVYTAGFGEGVQILFCIFNGHCEASKQLVIT